MTYRPISTYLCQLCDSEFEAEEPRDDETNADVACPKCHRVDTHLVHGAHSRAHSAAAACAHTDAEGLWCGSPTMPNLARCYLDLRAQLALREYAESRPDIEDPIDKRAATLEGS